MVVGWLVGCEGRGGVGRMRREPSEAESGDVGFSLCFEF